MRISAVVTPSEYFHTLYLQSLAWERGREVGAARGGPIAPARAGHAHGLAALAAATRFARVRALRGETHEPVHAPVG